MPNVDAYEQMRKIEYRMMEGNMQGLEFTQSIRNMFSEYRAEHDDPTFPLRRLRTLAQDFLRVLGANYPQMSKDDKVALLRLGIFEAAHRQWLATQFEEEPDEEKHKLRLLIRLMHQHEQDDLTWRESGNFIKLIIGGNNITSKIEEGKHMSQVSWRALQERGSAVALNF